MHLSPDPAPAVYPETTKQGTSFPEFLAKVRQSLTDAFPDRKETDRQSLSRGMSPGMRSKIMASNPLSVSIPTAYGGRGGLLHENLAVLSVTAYESLALSLTFAINGALFLQPFAKYGQDSVKEMVFGRFMKHQAMGGLMITEPNHGSDAFRMRTSFIENEKGYHVHGTKHWAGLTGLADFWLLTARERVHDGKLKRDIDFFLCDSSEADQKIIVEEYFENLGLYQIPYGRNLIDVQLPATHRLIPRSTGVHLMIDLLHRSRLHGPGVGLGFINRLLDEAIEHTKNRMMGHLCLLDHDQVQSRITRMQAAFTICSAFSLTASELSLVNEDLSPFRLEANVIKTMVSDLMQESSQSLLQLLGAKGYRLNHIAGRATVDSRPFQIFEGPNDILYAQVAESILDSMKKYKEYNLFLFLNHFFGDNQVTGQITDDLSLNIDAAMPQRKLVEFGRLLSRIISMQSIFHLRDRGFRNDLIMITIASLQQEISGMLSTYHCDNRSKVIEEYGTNSNWMNCLEGTA